MSDSTTRLRHDWTLQEIRALHDLPLFELVDRARAVHLQFHQKEKVQLCTLLSVKTGGCPEDCAYCPQSSKHDTAVKGEAMLKVDEVLSAARAAKEHGATRFCMGAAWREVKDGPAFDRVLDMVRGVKGMGLEACVTLGMLNEGQARKLKEAGLDAYNHNLDTSRENYKSIISTRTRAFTGTLSGCGSSCASSSSMPQRSLMLSPMPMMPPEHTVMPALRTFFNVFKRSS